jgi:hypothetical protein
MPRPNLTGQQRARIINLVFLHWSEGSDVIDRQEVFGLQNVNFEQYRDLIHQARAEIAADPDITLGQLIQRVV